MSVTLLETYFGFHSTEGTRGMTKKRVSPSLRNLSPSVTLPTLSLEDMIDSRDSTEEDSKDDPLSSRAPSEPPLDALVPLNPPLVPLSLFLRVRFPDYTLFL